MIPLSTPVMNGNEWKYIKDCLDTGWVSSVGSYVNRFEEIVAQYVGVHYGVAIVNGTSALHLSLLANNVGPNDEVIVPALTFIAPVNALHYCGAHPVFMDCDPKTLCMDVNKVADFLAQECVHKNDGFTYNKKTNRQIKAIIPVHIFGHPVDMDPLIEICDKFNILVIEDATESLGSEYKGRRLGSFGIIGCLSFNGNKIITTGGGGMVLTKEEHLAKRIKHRSTQSKSDPIEYDHDEVGFNYRLTNLQAAMGVAQMEVLPDFINIKRTNVEYYRMLLKDVPDVELLWEMPWAKSNFWFYTLKVKKEHKNPLLQHLLKNHIHARPLWKLISTLPMYNECQSYRLEHALKAYDTCINLPCSVNLSKEDMEKVVAEIKGYFKHAK